MYCSKKQPSTSIIVKNSSSLIPATTASVTARMEWQGHRAATLFADPFNQYHFVVRHKSSKDSPITSTQCQWRTHTSHVPGMDRHKRYLACARHG
jgi:hypothetical protein